MRITASNFAKLATNPVLVAGFLFVSSIALHLPFLLTDSFGEQDCARLAISSILSFYKGEFTASDYLPFSSPLYVSFFYWLLKINVISVSDLPAVMSYLSLFSSGLLSAMFFLFIYLATSSIKLGFAASVIMQFNPTVFFNSIYGFPSILSLALFTTSLVVLFHTIKNKNKINSLSLAVFFILYVVSILIKLDTILASALLCLPLWQSGRSLKSRVIWIFVFFGMSLGVFVLQNKLGVALSGYSEASTHWESWGERFYKGFGIFFSKENILIIARATGIFSIPVAAAGLLLFLIISCPQIQKLIYSVGKVTKNSYLPSNKNISSLILWVLAGFMPVMILWGVIGGNSARHNLIPAIFIPVLLALPLVFKWIGKAWLLVLILMLALNYFWLPPLHSTIQPSGRFFESSYLLKKRTEKYHKNAAILTHKKHEKAAVIDISWRVPYAVYEYLAASHLTFVKNEKGRFYFNDGKNEKIVTFLTTSKKHRKKAKELKKEGFVVLRAR